MGEQNIDTGASLFGQEINGSDEPQYEAADKPNTEQHSALVSWLAERDSGLAATVEDLEKRRPDRFSSLEEQMAYLEEVATVVGRREELNEIMQQLAAEKH